MSKKLKIRCPCGYDFETFENQEEAIVVIQAHFEQFHADLLPFGLSREEASAFLKMNRQISKNYEKNADYYNQSKIFTNQVRSSYAEKKTKRVEIIKL